MEANEKDILKTYAKYLDQWVKSGILDKPTVALQNAISHAVVALTEYQEATKQPCQRHIGMLRYHVKQPQALLFRDKGTLEAMKAGRDALTWKVKRRAEK